MAPRVHLRDLTSSLNEAKATLSSWDKCMSKPYCKWPVIVGIVIGSVILISVIWCIISCVCCGASCCCGCLSCLSCCNSCCPRRKRNGHKRVDSMGPSAPDYASQFRAPGALDHASQYRAPDAPDYTSQHRAPDAPSFPQQRTPETPSYPQYAQFDEPSKPINPDALPPMPSWSDATSRKVEATSPGPSEVEDVELSRLDHNGHKPGSYSNLKLQDGAPAPARSPVRRQPDNSYFPEQPPSYQKHNMPYEDDRFHNGSYNSRAQAYAPQDDYQQQGYGYAYETSTPSRFAQHPEHVADQHYAPYSSSTGGYATSGSTQFEQPLGHHPNHSSSLYSGSYQRSQPQSHWQDPYVDRKPVQGSWKDI